jgi:hypothetical protein
MPSTKLWLVSHVAIARTAKPMVEASSTRQPNCSRIGMRILTISQPPEQKCVSHGRGRGEGAEPREVAGISQLCVSGAGRRAKRGSRRAWYCVYPIPRGRISSRSFQSCQCEMDGRRCQRSILGCGRCDGVNERAASRMQRALRRDERRLFFYCGWARTGKKGRAGALLGVVGGWWVGKSAEPWTCKSEGKDGA